MSGTEEAMSGVDEIVRGCGLDFAALCDCPYWVCVDEEPSGPQDPTAEPYMEYGTGSFADWYPERQPKVIVAVVPATAFGEPASSSRRTRHRHRAYGPTKPLAKRGCLVCGVAADGDAYAMMVSAGRVLIEGAPSSGRLLDVIRSKFQLPPGPPSAHDLDLAAWGPLL